MLGLWAAYQMLIRRGVQPFPRAPSSDLKSVLKGLYLQQRLVDFAILNQGSGADDLHRAFGDFIARTRPGEIESPTQARGVLKA
jgi:hypothetical protein